MSRKSTIGALIVGLAVLAGPTTSGAAYAKGPLDVVREAHERHVRMIKKAHARHMRVIHRVERAHERHVSHAPRPVREVHRFVHQRHRAHVRAAERAHERHVNALERFADWLVGA